MIDLPDDLMKNSVNILAFRFMNISTHASVHVCFVLIYCKKKLRFPILIFVIEEIKTSTADVPCKSDFKFKYSQTSTYSSI